eukprot:TRINITY_DN16733_c1_g2_i1.p1 TRINITY_DN16733_c1_g2~~TRINITY_DN16733_c1_g2_i1.p1  ORF type:complete len:356 (-),score=36.03 TRINITY_DN16733_c1_g2_i1:29-1096(-)
MCSYFVVIGLWMPLVGVVESITSFPFHSKRHVSMFETPEVLSPYSRQNNSQRVIPSSLSRAAQDPQKNAIVPNGKAWVDSDMTSSPYGWVQQRKDATSQVLYHMHIPKTAGVSFVRDLLTTLPSSVGIYSWEACYPEFVNLISGDMGEQLGGLGGGIVTMLRDPSDQVYSQYRMCFDTDWGKEQMATSSSKGASMSFSAWLQHFTTNFTTDDFNCYHPFNMQTRGFTCQYPEDPHHESDNPEEHGVGAAVENMIHASFVGITELYQESLCLLHAHFNMQLPGWCDCEDKLAWSSFEQSNVDHGSQAHDRANLTEQDRVLLDMITENDRLLYDVAVARFREHARLTERRLGVKILC